MADVFISSIQAGFEDVRAAARAGVETYGHRAGRFPLPLRAELSGGVGGAHRAAARAVDVPPLER